MNKKDELDFILKDFFIEYYKKLQNGSILISLELDINQDEKNRLYAIDNSYKVIRNDIKDPYNGYKLSNFIINNNNIMTCEKSNEDMINGAFENGSLYAIPSYRVNNGKKINKALFLDRDGVLMEDLGYVGEINRVVIKKDFIDIVKYAKEKGYITIVTTNQAGVSYGYYEEQDVKKVHKFIYEEYKKQGAIIDDFYYCPYHIKGMVKKYSKETLLRKPEPGLHLIASKAYNIDISSSIMIGDRDSDIIKLPYLKTVLIETDNYKIKNRDSIVSTKDIYDYLK